MSFNWIRFFAVMRKEFIQIKWDKGSLLLLIGMPLFLMFFYGYAMDNEMKHISAAVWDQDNSFESRQFLQSLENSEFFDINYRAHNYEEISDYFNTQSIKLAIIIPSHFSRLLREGNNGGVQVLVDGTDPLTANTALSSINIISMHHSLQAQLKFFSVHGGPPGSLVTIDSQIWYNPDLDSRIHNIPDLIGFILQNVIVTLSAFSVVREKENGTLEQLAVTPMKSVELILGKLFPYLAIGFVCTIGLLVIGINWFGVESEGSILLILGVSIVFLISLIAIGLLISTIVKTQLQAMQMSLLVLTPSALITGFSYPLESMSQFTQFAAQFIPFTHYLAIIRSVYLKGASFQHIWPEFLKLCMFGTIVLFIAIINFRKKID